MVDLRRFNLKYYRNNAGVCLLAAARQHRPGLLVGTEIIDAVDRQQFGEPGARAVDARLDSADGAAADVGGFFVGKSGGADQNERFALAVSYTHLRAHETDSY